MAPESTQVRGWWRVAADDVEGITLTWHDAIATIDVERLTDAIAEYYRETNGPEQRPWQRRLAEHIAAYLEAG
jgi:hypothetical protein